MKVSAAACSLSEEKPMKETDVRAKAFAMPLEVLSTVHILADLTLGLGKVVYDYLAPSLPRPMRSKEKVAAS
jgi:hypothetical protein